MYNTYNNLPGVFVYYGEIERIKNPARQTASSTTSTNIDLNDTYEDIDLVMYDRNIDLNK